LSAIFHGEIVLHEDRATNCRSLRTEKRKWFSTPKRKEEAPGLLR